MGGRQLQRTTQTSQITRGYECKNSAYTSIIHAYEHTNKLSTDKTNCNQFLIKRNALRIELIYQADGIFNHSHSTLGLADPLEGGHAHSQNDFKMSCDFKIHAT